MPGSSLTGAVLGIRPNNDVDCPNSIMAYMKKVIVALVSGSGDWLVQFLVWEWSHTVAAWRSAWGEPARIIRMVYLAVGVLFSCHLIPDAFQQFGRIGGGSYLLAPYRALSSATLFKAVRVPHGWIPLGLVAPIFIFLGVAGSDHIKPLIGDAKSALWAHDLVSTMGILLIYWLLSKAFNRWRSGNPYDDIRL